MTYTRFEQLVLGIGAAAILGSLALSLPAGDTDLVEVFAQVMLIGVLFAAVTWGRRGGMAAALVAAAVYVVARIPLLASGDITGPALVMLITRLLSFGLVGILVAESCARLKYALARLEGQSALDDWSRVYNQPYIHSELVQACGRFRRYQEVMSVVVVEISSSVLADLAPARQRTVVRGIAEHIRADVRMVDEVARADDGRFLALLPHTPKAGGVIVTERLVRGVRSAVGARDEAVRVTCLSLPEDETAIDALIASLAPEPAQDSSGAYSSAGESTRKPAAASTASAFSSSTLNTSTAASPEGSTKQ